MIDDSHTRMEPGDDTRSTIELLAEEFATRLRSGERATIEEYAARHSDHAADIRALFPTIARLEAAKGAAAVSSSSSGSFVDAASRRPERLGDFILLREIGRGGMGVVYEAEQESLARRVAVKVISRASLLHPRQLQRFEREAQAAAQLHHTNIVPVFGLGEHDGLHYYVMQLIEGNGLNDVLGEIRRLRHRTGGAPADASADTQPISPDAPSSKTDAEGKVATDDARDDVTPLRPITAHFPGGASLETIAQRSHKGDYWVGVARIGAQIASALAHAHSRRVLHRDIKPANVILDERGVAWMTDFGLAKLDDQNALTHSGDILGTLQYIAPESLEGHYDHRSDVYCLGLTLYELTTLRSPLGASSPARLLRDVSRRELERPRRIDPTIPRDLETIILKAVAMDPSRRYQHASDLAEELEAFVEGRPIAARRANALERLALWSRRNPAVSALSAAALLLLVLVAAVATVGYVKTQSALEVVSQQTQKAEANLRLALEAFDQIFSRAGPAGFRSTVDDWSEAAEEGGDELRFPPVVSDDLVVVLEKLLSFYERFAASNTDDPRLAAEMARAHLRVGDIQHRFGRSEEAEAAYRRGLELYAELADRTGDPGASWRERAQILNGLGELLRDPRQGGEAESARREALALLEGLPAEVRASAECRLELVRTHLALGGERLRGTPRGPRSPRAADEHRQAALDLAAGLVDEAPENPDYRLALARAYRDLPPPLWERNGLERDAEENPAAARAIAILEQLIAEHPSTPEYHFELSETYVPPMRRGPTGPDGRSETESSLRDAIEIVEELDRHYPGMTQYAEKLTLHRLRLANLLFEDGRNEDAVALLTKTRERLEGLVRAQPRVPTWRFFAMLALRDESRVRLAQGDAARAVELVRESIEELERFDARDPRSRGSSRLAWEQYETLAEALRALGRTEEAEEASRQARALEPRRRGGGRGGPRPPGEPRTLRDGS